MKEQSIDFHVNLDSLFLPMHISLVTKCLRRKSEKVLLTTPKGKCQFHLLIFT